MKTITLFRPTGPEEMALVKSFGYKRWPARLPEQPIFYPVTNERYAREITEQWNIKDSGKGFVTKFEVKESFMPGDEVQQVDASHHTEWWVPGNDVEDLNNNIVGLVQITGEFT